MQWPSPTSGGAAQQECCGYCAAYPECVGAVLSGPLATGICTVYHKAGASPITLANGTAGANCIKQSSFGLSQKHDDEGLAPPPSHLKYMSYYGFSPAVMEGWLNLGLAQIGDGNCHVGHDNCNMSGVLSAYTDYQIPSLYGDLPIQWDTSPGAKKVAGAIFIRGVGLAEGWEQSMEKLVAKDIAPHFGKSKALRGVFLGDEICCGTANCRINANFCWNFRLKMQR